MRRWTHQIFYSVNFVFVGEHAGAVVSEQAEQIGRLGDVQTNIIPIVEILEEGRVSHSLSLPPSLPPSLPLSLSLFRSLSLSLSLSFSLSVFLLIHKRNHSHCEFMTNVNTI